MRALVESCINTDPSSRPGMPHILSTAEAMFKQTNTATSQKGGRNIS